jgi:hypothetical protein
MAEHPDTISKKVLDDQGDHGPNKRHLESGHIWVDQAIHITEARGEPVVQVRTAESRLYCLD